jgi:hypothetical protein
VLELVIEMESSLYIIMSLGGIMFVVGLCLLYRRVKSLLRQEKRILLVEYIGIGMLTLSLLFIASAIVMIPLQSFDNELNCDISIWACIFLYTTNKIFLYIYLIEKSHIINCALSKFEKRAESKLYKSNMISLSLWSVVLVLMIMYRKSSVNDDGECHIGLTSVASVSLLVFDTLYRIYLMALFVWPLWRYANESAVVMTMAKKNLFGAVLSLLCSFLNLLSVVFANGHEQGHMCLLYCMLDVFVNVVIMNWLLTSHRDKPLQLVSKILQSMKLDSVTTVTHDIAYLKSYKDAAAAATATEVRSPLPSCLVQPSACPRIQSQQRVKFADNVSYSDRSDLPRPSSDGARPPHHPSPSPPPESGTMCQQPLVPIRKESPRNVVGVTHLSDQEEDQVVLRRIAATVPTTMASSSDSDDGPTKYCLK